MWKKKQASWKGNKSQILPASNVWDTKQLNIPCHNFPFALYPVDLQMKQIFLRKSSPNYQHFLLRNARSMFKWGCVRKYVSAFGTKSSLSLLSSFKLTWSEAGG
jgi:hypothetical protein